MKTEDIGYCQDCPDRFNCMTLCKEAKKQQLTCEMCPKRHGNKCSPPCPDEVKQKELNVGATLDKVQWPAWPTVPKPNEKIPEFQRFYEKLSRQQRELLSFLLAGYEREKILQLANITRQTFDVQVHRIKQQSKVLLSPTPLLREGNDMEGKMKISDSPLQRIELKVRLYPTPVFDEEVIFHVDSKENQEFVKRLYDTLIEPMVRSHLNQLTNELRGMAVAFELLRKCEERGLDFDEVCANEKLRLQLLSEDDGESNAE